MKLLALVLLLSALSSLALTEVVRNFKNCRIRKNSFFVRNPENQKDIIVPTIFSGRQYKKICQRYNKQYRFATVYDTEKRIPVYSAYTFLTEGDTTRYDDWKIEPQLDYIRRDEKGNLIKDGREMMDSPNIKQAKAMNITHQAVDQDYAGSGFTRGHVFPRSYAADQDQADSTFTLTNIVPQEKHSNEQWAMQVEEKMLKNITDNCRLDKNHQAYIVTGVVPGKKWIKITRDQDYEKGINVPSHFWSAFCCTSKNHTQNLIGTAYIAQQENFRVRNVGIHNLNRRLTELLKKDFSVFPGLTIEKIEPPF